MKEQLLKLLSHYNYSASLFAEKIGVQRSSISHILSGRNKPSYDFIISILNEFPEINALWLLTGQGEMLKIAENQKDIVKNNSHVDDIINDSTLPFNENPSTNNTNRNVYKSNIIQKITSVNEIKALLILYTDGSFEKFTSR